MSLSPGSRLGPYEILSPLGTGGMGEVYKAQDTRLGRTVAIKRLLTPHSERFAQEARAIAALNHPHICQIHDVGPDYLVLEHVDGRPLQGPLAVGEALRLAIEIASALEEAHRRGILHRDLKPANIMVTAAGDAKLLDFGLARLADADADATRTAEGTVMGTAAYMSPEQADGKPLDGRSDVFSFGAVLYEMLSGSRAFTGQSTLQVMNAVLRDEPGPLSAPAALVEIVKRCMQKRPDRRFQTMAEVRTALELERTSSASAVASVDQRPSIAVLPFADMSPGKDHEWFSDGLTEEIINALVQIPGLRVIARTSAFAFKSKQQDVRRIGEELGVGHLLEGSVRRAGERVRITAQLVTTHDGSHLWSERYDRDIADVFAIQDEMAHTISQTLKVRLSPASERHIPNLAAYESYLQARHALQRISAEQSLELVDRAIALDPAFPNAYALRGYILWALSVLQTPTRRIAAHDVAPKAKDALLKALELDSSLPTAQATLGILAANYDYDWIEAESRLHKALARSPVETSVAFLCAQLLACLGRGDEGTELVQSALREDPLNTSADDILGYTLAVGGHSIESAAQYQRTLERNPRYFPACEALAIIHLSLGRLADAMSYAERAVAVAPGNPSSIGILAGLRKRLGDVASASGLLQQLGPGTQFGAPIGFALFYAVHDESDAAGEWLSKAIEQRDARVVIFLRLPIGKVWQASVHWPVLATLLNLPAEASNNDERRTRGYLAPL
jgi:serine/threonine-protein kinase